MWPDCHTETYAVSSSKLLQSDNDISIVHPNRADILAVETPLLTIVDLVTYTLSTLGFWFAFSPIVCLNGKIRKLLRIQSGKDADKQTQQLKEHEIRLQLLEKLLRRSTDGQPVDDRLI